MKFSFRLITLLVILVVLVVSAGLPAVSAANAAPLLQLDKGSPASLPQLVGVDSNSIHPLAIAPRSVQGATFIIDYVANGAKNGDYLDSHTCETFPEDAKAALQAAADQLATVINSSVPIRIEACWTGLPANLLEHSHPMGFSTWGNVAISMVLYNAFVGHDEFSEASCTNNQYPASWCDDISLVISNSANFYYGTDGNPGSKIDLETVAMRGILHGLGFASRAVAGSGQGYWGFTTNCTYPGPYDTFVVDGNGTKITNTSVYPCGTAALANILTSNNLYFAGPNAKAANGGNNVPLFAPNPWKPGGSYVHLANSFDGTPDALMTDSLAPGEAIHSVGPITLAMLKDLGWTTHAISGRVTIDGNALGGVTLSDEAGHTTTTDENGNYTLYDIPIGPHTITPSKTGYTFSPTDQSVTVAFSDRTEINFTAALTTYSISGRVALPNGDSLNGVTLSDGAGHFANTDFSGNYIFNNLLPGTYTITAAKSQYSFAPISQVMTITSGDLHNVDFTATFIGYTVSGKVILMTAGNVSDITISDEAGHSTMTAADGSYTLQGVSLGVHTITPTKAGYFFPMPSLTLNVQSNVTGANFTTWQKGYSIAGQIALENGTPVMGVTVAINGSIGITDTNGNYIVGAPSPYDLYPFGYLYPGSYTITPSKAHYVFAPTSQNVTLDSTNLTGINFTATFIAYPVSGKVTFNDSTPAVGVVVQTDTGYSTTTDADRNYSLMLPPGDHKLVLSKLKHTFSPISQTVTVAAVAQTDVNFTATFHPELQLFFLPVTQR